jgi:hypothetical protein
VLADLGGLLPGDQDLVGRPHGDQLALDLGDLASARVAQDQPVAQAQHLAVHVQDGLAMLVGDVGVLTQPEETLADQVHPAVLSAGSWLVWRTTHRPAG